VDSQAISSPIKIITSQDIHYKKCILKLCPSSHVNYTNSMGPRTTGSISLIPARHIQAMHNFFS